MNKILINLKYITFTLVLIIGIFTGVRQVSAFSGGGVVVYSDSIDIPYVVTSSSIPPVVDAGAPIDITLPTNSVTLPVNWATVTDPDSPTPGVIWTLATGASVNITNNTTLTPTFTFSIEGVYIMRLTATDNDGNVAFDDMTVTVHPVGGSNMPTANAGPDKSITLPTTSVSVTGSGTDLGGTIVGYAWTQVSRPAAATDDASISDPSSSNITITKLITVGDYVFGLVVTDNDGNTSAQDTMIVHVNPVGGGPLKPVVTIGAVPSFGTVGVVNPTITWSATNNPASCTATGDWSGNKTPASGGSEDQGILNTVRTYTYTLTCTNADGTSDPVSATVLVNPNYPIAGACGPTHDANPCAVGTVVNPPGIQTGSTSWTWTCMEDTVSPQCSQTFPVTQCNDNVDNDSDGLKDSFDPGCHTDGIVIPGNENQTYDPLDTNEKNNPKVKVKEL